MTDRYRYLPCALHEALVAPDWAGENGEGGGPFPVLSNDHTAEEYGIYFVDLAHPAGWDHAVRALLTIGHPDAVGDVVESVTPNLYINDTHLSVSVEYASNRHVELRFTGDDRRARSSFGHKVHNIAVPGLYGDRWRKPWHFNGSTPAGRREALCRCICAALNLDPTTVFPVEPA